MSQANSKISSRTKGFLNQNTQQTLNMCCLQQYNFIQQFSYQCNIQTYYLVLTCPYVFITGPVLKLVLILVFIFKVLLHTNFWDIQSNYDDLLHATWYTAVIIHSEMSGCGIAVIGWIPCNISSVIYLFNEAIGISRFVYLCQGCHLYP